MLGIKAVPAVSQDFQACKTDRNRPGTGNVPYKQKTTTTCTSDKPDLIKCHIVNFYIPLLYNILFNACMRKNHIMWRDNKCVFVLPEACSLLKRRFMKSKLRDKFGLKELQITSYRCFYYITRLTSILTDGEVCLKLDIKGKHVFV